MLQAGQYPVLGVSYGAPPPGPSCPGAGPRYRHCSAHSDTAAEAGEGGLQPGSYYGEKERNSSPTVTPMYIDIWRILGQFAFG